MSEGPEKGAVQILCEEIGFRFDPRMERSDILVAFVRELVDEVSDIRMIQVRIAAYTGKTPSPESRNVLALSRKMLAIHPADRADLIAGARRVHDLVHELGNDEKVPCDHLVDTLSSCASAIRFGLEIPCHSRHAASAAQHVWNQKYGCTLSDGFSPAWEKEWARAKLQDALVSMLPPPVSDDTRTAEVDRRMGEGER